MFLGLCAIHSCDLSIMNVPSLLAANARRSLSNANGWEKSSGHLVSYCIREKDGQTSEAFEWDGTARDYDPGRYSLQHTSTKQERWNELGALVALANTSAILCAARNGISTGASRSIRCIQAVIYLKLVVLSSNNRLSKFEEA